MTLQNTMGRLARELENAPEAPPETQANGERAPAVAADSGGRYTVLQGALKIVSRAGESRG